MCSCSLLEAMAVYSLEMSGFGKNMAKLVPVLLHAPSSPNLDSLAHPSPFAERPAILACTWSFLGVWRRIIADS